MDCRTKPLTYNAMIQLHTITLTLARTYLGFYIFITFVFLHWLSTVLRARGKKKLHAHTQKKKKRRKIIVKKGKNKQKATSRPFDQSVMKIGA